MARPRTLPDFNPNIPTIFLKGGKYDSLERFAKDCLAKNKTKSKGFCWLRFYERALKHITTCRMQEVGAHQRSVLATEEEINALRWIKHEGKWLWRTQPKDTKPARSAKQ